MLLLFLTGCSASLTQTGMESESMAETVGLSSEEASEETFTADVSETIEELPSIVHTRESVSESLASAGITEEHFSYHFISSFILGEYDVMAPMIGMTEGMEECFDGLVIGEWSAEKDMDFEPFYSPFDETMRPVTLTFEVRKSGIERLSPGSHVFYINVGFIYEIALTVDPQINTAESERSAAQSALNIWFGTVSECRLPVYDENASEEEKKKVYSAVGDYLGLCYGAMPLEEYERLAKICFGITDFQPVVPLMQLDDGNWYVGGHGGSTSYREKLSEVADGDTTVITVKRYADSNRFIEADIAEFVMRDTGERINDIPVFFFEKVTVTPLSQWKAGGSTM